MSALPDPTPLDVPALLRRWGLRPDKSLGQNFLIDEVALRKVAEAAEIGEGDRVMEIGPGLGSLTRHLASRALQVVAVELDAGLIPPLREVLAPYPNVSIVQGDILELDPVDLMDSHRPVDPPSASPLTGTTLTGSDVPAVYLVVANIPYYITSALIRHLLEAGRQHPTSATPRRLVLTVQREVAMRITAGPGDLSLLALSVQVYGKPQIAARIPAGSFYPPPKVDSAVVKVDIYPEPLIPTALLPAYFRLAKAGFSQKRKTLRNALSAGLALPPAQVESTLRSAGIDPMRRAETVSIPEWLILSEKFTALKKS